MTCNLLSMELFESTNQNSTNGLMVNVNFRD